MILAARVPANAAAGAESFPLPPIAASPSQTTVLGTRPAWLISCHIPRQDVAGLLRGDHHRGQVT